MIGPRPGSGEQPHDHSPAQARVEDWFAVRGWEPFAYQREVWDAYSSGESGLIHVDTGMGKTMSAAGGPVIVKVTPPPISGK